jgi:serine/threonine-protein kinase
MRLAGLVCSLHLALWLARAHIIISIGTFGIFLMSLATAVFYGVLMWVVNMALEPYVRRRWPQNLISWTALLIGQVRDAVVGRDVLIGCAAGVAISLIGGLQETWLRHKGGWPNLENTLPLTGIRSGVAMELIGVLHGLREALFFFFLIFLLRAILRNQWVAGVAFALIFASLDLASGSEAVLNTSVTFVVLLTMAFVVLRWGLLSLCVTLLFSNLASLPLGGPSAWYFGSTAFVVAGVMALAAWAFYISLGGRKLWKEDFFG